MVSPTSWPTVRSAGGSGGGRSGTERRQNPRDGVGERVEGLLHSPVHPPVVVAVRDGAKLERRDACKRSRTKDGEAFHRFDLGVAGGPAHASCGPDRQNGCLGKGPPGGREQLRIRGGATHELDS